MIIIDEKDLQEWIEIKIENGSPCFIWCSHLHLCEDQLVLYGGWEDSPGGKDLQKCWSLPISKDLFE